MKTAFQLTQSTINTVYNGKSVPLYLKVLTPNTLKNKEDQFRKHWTDKSTLSRLVFFIRFYASSPAPAEQPVFSWWGKHILPTKEQHSEGVGFRDDNPNQAEEFDMHNISRLQNLSDSINTVANSCESSRSPFSPPNSVFYHPTANKSL